MTKPPQPKPAQRTRRPLTGLVGLGLLLAAFAALAATPTASAHTCATYDGCDANGCKDGENHDHTDYNRVERDESCTSSSRPDEPPPPPPEPCIIAGKEFPKAVCDFIEDLLGEGVGGGEQPDLASVA